MILVALWKSQLTLVSIKIIEDYVGHMVNQQRLIISLFVIRVSVGLFFLIWAIEKIVHPELTNQVFSTFYHLQIPNALSIGFGILQLLIVLMFMVGLFKIWSYGLLLGMHAVSTISTYERLLNPYEPPNHLFWAAVPTLGAIIALFLLRKGDRLLTAELFLPVREKKL
ncbi:MAG: DoxX protein [Cyanobacteria bacterium P01_E01_bin.6]